MKDNIIIATIVIVYQAMRLVFTFTKQRLINDTRMHQRVVKRKRNHKADQQNKFRVINVKLTFKQELHHSILFKVNG